MTQQGHRALGIGEGSSQPPAAVVMAGGPHTDLLERLQVPEKRRGAAGDPGGRRPRLRDESVACLCLRSWSCCARSAQCPSPCKPEA